MKINEDCCANISSQSLKNMSDTPPIRTEHSTDNPTRIPTSDNETTSVSLAEEENFDDIGEESNATPSKINKIRVTNLPQAKTKVKSSSSKQDDYHEDKKEHPTLPIKSRKDASGSEEKLPAIETKIESD